MRELFRTRLGTYYIGDCRDVGGLSERGDFCIITDPPYSSGGFQESGRSVGSLGTKHAKIGDAREIIADRLTTRGMLRLLRDSLRPLRKANEVYIFCNWKQWANIFDTLEDLNYQIRSMIVWAKPNAAQGNPWLSQHELICYARNNATPARPVMYHGNVIQCARSRNIHHPTEKPLDLMMTLVRMTAAETIIDPFAGSGSTAVACELLKRRWVAIDYDEGFARIAQKRIAAATAQRSLFVEEEEEQREQVALTFPDVHDEGTQPEQEDP